MVIVPYWFLVVVFAAAAAWGVVVLWQRRRPPPDCLLRVRLRPPRHARPLPGVRGGSEAATRERSGRVRRRLFNLAAAVSMVLCVGTLVLWVRSYWIGDQWDFQRDSTRSGQSTLFAARANSSRGGIEVSIESGHARRSVPDRSETQHDARPPYPLIFQSLDQTLSERLGLRLSSEPAALVHNAETTDGTSTIVNFPYCFPAIVFAGMPLMWGIAWGITARRRRRALSGVCRSCGYDLRGTPDRCPECGAKAKRSPVEGAAV